MKRQENQRTARFAKWSRVVAVSLCVTLVGASYGPVQAAGLLEGIGKAIDKGVKETGKAIEKGVKATGEVVEDIVTDTGKAIDKGVKETGKFIDRTGDAAADVLSRTGRDLDRATRRTSANVYRGLKTGYCRLTEGFVPEAGNDQNNNGLDDDYERCMANGKFVRTGTSGGTHDKALSAEQAFIDAFNVAVQVRFAADDFVDAGIFTNPESFHLVPQGTVTARIVNEPGGVEPYISASGVEFASRDLYLVLLANEQIIYLTELSDEVGAFEFGRGRLQVAEGELSLKAAANLAVDMAGGVVQQAGQGPLYGVGRVRNVIDGDSVKLHMLARTGQVPLLGDLATFSSIAVIGTALEDAVAEKKRIIDRLQKEIELLKLRIVEIGI